MLCEHSIYRNLLYNPITALTLESTSKLVEGGQHEESSGLRGIESSAGSGTHLCPNIQRGNQRIDGRHRDHEWQWHHEWERHDGWIGLNNRLQ